MKGNEREVIKKKTRTIYKDLQQPQKGDAKIRSGGSNYKNNNDVFLRM